MGAMGVPRNELPNWNDIQIMVAQLHRKPFMKDIPVGKNLAIGPNARKPLELKIAFFVSNMSFGALSEEAKTAMALRRQPRDSFSVLPAYGFVKTNNTITATISNPARTNRFLGFFCLSGASSSPGKSNPS